MTRPVDPVPSSQSHNTRKASRALAALTVALIMPLCAGLIYLWVVFDGSLANMLAHIQTYGLETLFFGQDLVRWGLVLINTMFPLLLGVLTYQLLLIFVPHSSGFVFLSALASIGATLTLLWLPLPNSDNFTMRALASVFLILAFAVPTKPEHYQDRFPVLKLAFFLLACGVFVFSQIG